MDIALTVLCTSFVWLLVVCILQLFRAHENQKAADVRREAVSYGYATLHEDDEGETYLKWKAPL